MRLTILTCACICISAHMGMYPHVAACAWLALEMILNIKLAKMEKGVLDKLGYVRDGSG